MKRLTFKSLALLFAKSLGNALAIFGGYMLYCIIHMHATDAFSLTNKSHAWYVYMAIVILAILSFVFLLILRIWRK